MTAHCFKFVTTIAVSFLFVGCGGGDPAADIVAERNQTSIQKIGNAYILYSALNQNRGPKNKEELIDFVSSYEGIDRNLGLMGIERTGFENHFVSSVDAKEFEVRWGLRINPDGAAVPLVFEQEGDGNVRRVALSDSRILEVEDDKKYNELLAGKISKGDAGSAAWEGGGNAPDE